MRSGLESCAKVRDALPPPTPGHDTAVARVGSDCSLRLAVNAMQR